MNIPLDKAEFLALFLETFAYGAIDFMTTTFSWVFHTQLTRLGVFFALCWITVHILFWNRKDGIRTGGFLLYVALFMLVLATAVCEQSCHHLLCAARLTDGLAMWVLINVNSTSSSTLSELSTRSCFSTPEAIAATALTATTAISAILFS